jgi:hypothetical protein
MIEHAYQHIVGMHLSIDKNENSSAMCSTFLSRIKWQAEVQMGFWFYCSCAANVGEMVETKKFVNIFGAFNWLRGTGRPCVRKPQQYIFPYIGALELG